MSRWQRHPQDLKNVGKVILCVGHDATTRLSLDYALSRWFTDEAHCVHGSGQASAQRMLQHHNGSIVAIIVNIENGIDFLKEAKAQVAESGSNLSLIATTRACVSPETTQYCKENNIPVVTITNNHGIGTLLILANNAVAPASHLVASSTRPLHSGYRVPDRQPVV